MIEYDVTEWWGLLVYLRLNGSMMPRSLPLSMLSAMLSLLLSTDVLASDIVGDRSLFGHPYCFQIYAVFLTFLVVFRSTLAYGRYWEGITAIMLMHSKWDDAILQAIAFDLLSTGTAKETGTIFRNNLVHLGSLLSACAVQELNKDSTKDLDQFMESVTCHHIKEKTQPVRTISGVLDTMRAPKQPEFKLVVLGDFDTEELKELAHTDDRVVWTMNRIVRSIAHRAKSGGLAMPPPIVSRIFQELSNGMLGYQQAHKVSYLPFPLPYAQLLAYGKFVFAVILPWVVADFTVEPVLAVFLTFFICLTFVSLNAVACEIEDPFGTDANDLPMEKLHHHFCVNLERLVTIDKEEIDDYTTERHALKAVHIESVRAQNEATFLGKLNLRNATSVPAAANATSVPVANATSVPVAANATSVPVAANATSVPVAANATSVGQLR